MVFSVSTVCMCDVREVGEFNLDVRLLVLFLDPLLHERKGSGELK